MARIAVAIRPVMRTEDERVLIFADLTIGRACRVVLPNGEETKSTVPPHSPALFSAIA